MPASPAPARSPARVATSSKFRREAIRSFPFRTRGDGELVWGKVEIGALNTARKGIASRTLPIPAALLDAVKVHLRDHTQIGRAGLLFWRASDGGPIRSAAWLKVFKKACASVGR